MEWWWLDLIFDVLVACIIAVVAVFLAGFVKRQVRNIGRRHDRFDETLFNFLGTVANYTVLTFALIFIPARFGIQTASLIAVIGGMALAVGLALQGTLSNVASGVMILVQKPFRVGEGITVGGITAVVQDIGLFTTELKQFDGLFVMIPNSELWNQPIVNFNRHPTRRFELIVGIGYDDSMQQAREELLKLAEADERVLPEPAPAAYVASLDDSSVGIGLRVWCATGDYLGLSWDLTEQAKARFDAKGISIPFPQREITTKAA